MHKINSFEQQIITLISVNKSAKSAFEKMYSRYLEEAEKELSHHAEIIEAIYVKRDFEHLWQLTSRFFLGESTLCRYRKKYVSWFYYYFEKITNANLTYKP